MKSYRLTARKPGHSFLYLLERAPPPQRASKLALGRSTSNPFLNTRTIASEA
jgi:hypothetical protein